MSLSSSVTSYLPPNLPADVLANGVSVTGGLSSAYGETVVLWLDGGPAVFTRDDGLGPFSRAALSKQEPLSLEEEGISRLLRVRLADGKEVTLEPGYFEATELQRLLSGESTTSGAPSSRSYSSSNYSTSYQSGDYSSSSYGTSSTSSGDYSSSSYGSGSSPYMFTPSYSDATDAADEADDNRVTSAVSSASAASASVASRASSASSKVSSSKVASSKVASSKVASSKVASSKSAGRPPKRAGGARVASKPTVNTSTKDLFNDLPSPYADGGNTGSPYADAARADSPYDHDHSKKSYDHAARPYADAKKAKSPYDLDAERHAFDADHERHAFDADPERHAFDADPDRHAFDGDPARHAFDADPDRHAFDADPERHAFDADPERHAFDADGPPPKPSAGMSAFEIDDEIKRVIREEGRFSAIQRYRKLTGAGLNEARTAVDNLMRPSSLPRLTGTSMVAEEPKRGASRFFWAIGGLFALGWLMENC